MSDSPDKGNGRRTAMDVLDGRAVTVLYRAIMLLLSGTFVICGFVASNALGDIKTLNEKLGALTVKLTEVIGVANGAGLVLGDHERRIQGLENWRFSLPSNR